MISPQGTRQGSTDVRVRTVTHSREVGRRGEEGDGRGRWQRKTKQQKLESSLLRS